MRVGCVVLTLLVGCNSGGEDGMFPVGGGGNDGGFAFPDGGVVADGAPADGSTISDATPTPIDAAVFTGRVCLAADPRDLDDCATTGAGGLTVRLGDKSAVTADDGTFMIEASSATVWTVAGPNIVTSVMRVSDYEIPAITRAQLDAMIAANLMPFPPNPGEGHVIAQLVSDGMPVANATAMQPPTATWAPFYDGADATTWGRTATSTFGAVWIPNIDVGTANVSFDNGTDTITVSGLPIQDGAVTFTTVIFP